MTLIFKFKLVEISKKLIFSVLSVALFSSSLALAEITAKQEADLIKAGNVEILNVLAQRLIDPPHWSEGSTNGVWPKGDEWEFPAHTFEDKNLPKYLGYGQGTFDHWKQAYLFLLEHADHFPTLNDYSKIHALGFYNTPGDMFWGYYSKQIWEKFQEPQRKEMMDLLTAAQTSEFALNQLLSKGIENGRGKFRTSGDSSWSGKPWSTVENKPLLYNDAEFARLSKQPYLRPEIRKISAEGIDAKFWHPPGKEVKQDLVDLFSKTKLHAESLLRLKEVDPRYYRKQAILLASQFYIDLLLIHGMWDGVGRSSKLMRDWFLQYMGIAPPDSTPIDDMEYTAEEYAVRLTESIERTEEKMKSLEENFKYQGVLLEQKVGAKCEALFL